MGSLSTVFEMHGRITYLVLLKSVFTQDPQIDPFRTYCDDDQVTDTSTFLPFGSSQWIDSNDFSHEDISMWRDDRDQWILEEDDSYAEFYYRSYFGGKWFTKMCISSNGPVYMDRCSKYNSE